MKSGRILKAVWQIWDGKKRGATKKELNEVKGYYDEIIKEFPHLKDQNHPGNIYSRICNRLRRKGYFNKPENH